MGNVIDFPDKSAKDHEILEAFQRGVEEAHLLIDALYKNEGRVASAAITGLLSGSIRRVYDDAEDIDSARVMLVAILSKIDPEVNL